MCEGKYFFNETVWLICIYATEKTFLLQAFLSEIEKILTLLNLAKQYVNAHLRNIQKAIRAGFQNKR